MAGLVAGKPPVLGGHALRNLSQLGKLGVVARWAAPYILLDGHLYNSGCSSARRPDAILLSILLIRPSRGIVGDGLLLQDSFDTALLFWEAALVRSSTRGYNPASKRDGAPRTGSAGSRLLRSASIYGTS